MEDWTERMMERPARSGPRCSRLSVLVMSQGVVDNYVRAQNGVLVALFREGDATGHALAEQAVGAGVGSVPLTYWRRSQHAPGARLVGDVPLKDRGGRQSGRGGA